MKDHRLIEIFHHNIIMKAFLKLFDSELDSFLSTDYYIDAKVSPEKLIAGLLFQKQQKKLIKAIKAPTIHPMKALKIMSTLHMLILNSNNFYEFVEENLSLILTKDQFINSRFLEPYHKFLIKSCISKELYSNCKGQGLGKIKPFDMIFYTINMLKLLFVIVQKMPFLGRYYKNQYNNAVSCFVEIIASQAQRLYFAFKNSLSEIISKNEYYITNKDEENIIKVVLTDDLIFINEEMKKLFLDKYFYPLGKGIGVKLFRPEEQSAEVSKTINGIVSNHEETERRNAKMELQNTLFPGSGLVNWNYYEETLLSGPMNKSLQSLDSGIRQLDDIVLSEEQDEQEQQINQKKNAMMKKMTENEAETSSGTQHVKGALM